MRRLLLQGLNAAQEELEVLVVGGCCSSPGPLSVLVDVDSRRADERLKPWKPDPLVLYADQNAGCLPSRHR